MCKKVLQDNSKMTSNAIPQLRPFTPFGHKGFVKHLIRKVKKVIEEVDLTENELTESFFDAQDNKMVDEDSVDL